MFELTREKYAPLRFQFGSLESRRAGDPACRIRSRPGPKHATPTIARPVGRGMASLKGGPQLEKMDILSPDVIESKILLIRGKKVMLDQSLAELYRVETRALNQAVKRNLPRFPEDFMFQLTKEEVEALLRSQFVILKKGQHYKYLPYVFTENGVAMLSSVLNSERAIMVNIQIMRTFTRLREILSSHEELKQKLVQMEGKYDAQFKVVFEAIRALMAPPKKPKKKIGFGLREKQVGYGRK